ncbi:MAG: AI-2E family transporter [Planctomycetaceae bacterium]
MARVVSLTILSTLIVILGVTFFRVLAPFVLPLFLAGVTTLLVQPVFQKLIVRFKGRVRLAAGVLSVGVLLAILVPLTVGTLLASLELYTIANTVTDEQFIQKATKTIKGKTGDLDAFIDRAVDYANSYLPANRQADKIEARTMVRSRLRESLTGIGDRSLGSLGQTVSTTVSKTVDIVGQLLSATVAILVALTIYVISLYYFLADGPELIAAAEALIPVHVDYQRDLLNEFAKAVRSVVLATFMAAIAQGVATTVALEVLGFGHLLVILTLSIVFSLIPLAGAWLVWAPFAISLFASGHWIQGTLLTIYGLVVVGMLDNIVRAYVLNSDTKLHPLLALVSVLGGIQTMGLWGIFIGPIVASCLYALIRIFNTELFALSRERFGLTLEGPHLGGVVGTSASEHVAPTGPANPSAESASANPVPTSPPPEGQP